MNKQITQSPSTWRLGIILPVLGVLLWMSSSEAMAGSQRYIGFWRPGVGDSKIRQFDSWEEFTEKWEEYGKQDLRLQDLEVAKTDSDIKYTGTWVKGKGKYALLAYDNFKDFAEAWKEKLADKALQLIDVEVVTIDDKNFFIGVWGTGKGGSALFLYNNWADFTAKWSELAKHDRVLIDVEAFESNGTVNYVGVWENGVGKEQRLYNTDSFEKFEAMWKEFNKDDLRLVDVDIAAAGKQELYIGVWNKAKGGQYLWLADNMDAIQEKNKEMNAMKLDLVDIAMIEHPDPKPQGKPPHKSEGKPARPSTLYFSKGEPVKKDPVSGIEFPADMPEVIYPEFKGCNTDDRKTIERAWAMAHHHAWRAVQLFRFLDAAGDRRDDLWSEGYTAGSDLELRKRSWSPYAWFGSYEGGSYRYDFIRDAIFMSWESRFQKKMTAKCRRDDSGAHPCYLKNPGTNRPPSANHIVNGTINFCNRFFDDKDDRDRVRTILHETYHWLAPRGLAILDTHSHWDRNSKGWCRLSTDKMYGVDDVMHLATSRGCWGDPKYHKGMATRNNDNYAYFIRQLGEAIYNKNLAQFPE